MNRRVWIALAVIAVLVLFLAYWFLTHPPHRPEDIREVLIAAVYPETGPTASVGKSSLNGLLLAAEDINNSGQLPNMTMKVVHEDSKGEPATSVSAFKSLLARYHVKFAMGLHSNVCLAMIPVAKENGVLLVCEATHPKLSNQGPLIFRHAVTTGQETEKIAGLLRQKSRSRLAVFYQNDDYGHSLSDDMKGILGGSSGAHTAIVIAEEYDKKATDFQSGLTRIATANPDSLFIAGSGKPVGLIMKQCRQLGISPLIVTPTGFSITPDAATAAGDAASGTYTLAFEYEQSAAWDTFAKRYRDRFGSEPSSTAMLDYASLQILASAIARAGSASPESVSRELHKIEALETVTGTVRVLPSGDILSPIRIKGL